MTRVEADLELIIFDVNETLSDMEPIRDRFTKVGANEYQARHWFAGLLRDGFALTATGVNASFSTLIGESLRVVLDGIQLDRSLDASVEYISEGFGALTVHSDVVEGVRALSALGLRLVTLSNGSEAIAEDLLTEAGIAGQFERLMSVADAGIWKPAPASYRYALARCEVRPETAMLVSVHPWDIDGAKKEGLPGGWINRVDSPYPAYFAEPDLIATSITDLAAQLAIR